jgi:hypothetical protein
LNKRRDRREFKVYKNLLEIKKKLYKEEWKELEDNKK